MELNDLIAAVADSPNKLAAVSAAMLVSDIALLAEKYDAVLQGLITLDNDFAIHVSPHVEHTEINDEWLYRYDGRRISLPVVCSPSREFLEFHREHIYQL